MKAKTKLSKKDLLKKRNREIQKENKIFAALSPADRMRLIMENIVANNGTFVPEQKPKLKVSYSISA